MKRISLVIGLLAATICFSATATFAMPAAGTEGAAATAMTAAEAPTDAAPMQGRDLTQYVNPLGGTLSTYALSTGNTYPAIARPWGMNFWTPQTGKMGDGWQYVYTENRIRGFKQTHQPSPWINDYGQFSIMPVVGAPAYDEEERASWYSHKGETALPYYYKVYLAEHDVVAEFTPTERAAFFRFTFPQSDASYVVVDAFDHGSYVKIDPEAGRIIGYTTRNSGGVPDNFKNYFIIEFDKPFGYTATVADSTLTENALEATADHALALVGFSTVKGEQVHVRVASSFISFEQAERNLQELGDDSFEALCAKGRDAWNDVLGRIEVGDALPTAGPQAGPRPDGLRPDGPRPDGPQAGRPEGPRPDGQRPDGPQAGRPDGPRPDGPRPDGPQAGPGRPDGPRPDGQRPDGPRPDGPQAGRPAGPAATTDLAIQADRLRTFYSCLYRSLLFPRAFYEFDADGNPIHYSPYNGQVLPGYMYTDSGFWDTFRCLFPLLNLFYPSENLKMQEGLINAYNESGFFPEWASPGHRGCMVGNNSASILADAYLKGICVQDTATLYEGLVHGTEAVHPEVSSTGRLGYDYYNTLGYVPYNVGINESAARTLEYSYDDWCIWRVAKALGRPQEEISKFAARARNYRNLFDASSNLMRGRNEDGSFQEPFSPLKWGDAFTEGNSWHYTWSVFHDPQGLADLMGGREVMAQMLDSVFVVPPIYDDSYYGGVIHEIREMTVMNMGNYAHGNQPIQHMIYLYDYVGQPWKAQYWVREVMNRMYSSGPDAYCGDEDNGQTSAWYVFSALGFYPVCPGTDQYVMGAPLFRTARLHFENGNTLTISAEGNSDTNVYVDSVELNRETLTRNYLRHGELQDGGLLRIRMTAEPNTQRGTAEEDFPYSFSTDPDAD